MSKIIREIKLIVADQPDFGAYIGSEELALDGSNTVSGQGHVIVVSYDPKFSLAMVQHQNGQPFSGKMSKLDINYSYLITDVKFADIQDDLQAANDAHQKTPEE
ncbi:hypothetical protein [Liquorilactobacillus sicerae]|uniref:hypothetical protein n=1 Tax=Liquorilactobacillus sicerae TaxID=1416943 RepID=UPI0024814310|nr:hypothetical protein [Liquorilactobacillus sicerae]